MKRGKWRLQSLLMGFALCGGALGANDELISVLGPLDLDIQHLAAVRPGDRLGVRTGNELAIYTVRATQTDSHAVGTIEGNVATSPERTLLQIEWSPGGVIGLFQTASGAMVAMGTGSTALSVVEVPLPSNHTTAAHASGERMQQPSTPSEWEFFRLRVGTVSPILGEAVHDLAVAYHAKCGKPIPSDAVRDIFHNDSQFGARVIGLLTFAQPYEASCRDPETCVTFSRLRADYLAAVASVACKEAIADSQ